MHRPHRSTALAAGLGLLLAAAFGPAAAQTPPDWTTVYGEWTLDVYAGQDLITLTMTAAAGDAGPVIKVSEPSGMFTDSPAASVALEGDVLRYQISVPSPPDGMVLTWLVEAKVGADVMEGTISNSDMGMSVPLSGKRVRK